MTPFVLCFLFICCGETFECVASTTATFVLNSITNSSDGYSGLEGVKAELHSHQPEDDHLDCPAPIIQLLLM